MIYKQFVLVLLLPRAIATIFWRYSVVLFSIGRMCVPFQMFSLLEMVLFGFRGPSQWQSISNEWTSNRYDITVSRHGRLTGRINVERLMIICCSGIPEYLVAKMEKSIENPIFEQTLKISVACINLKCEQL